MAIGTSTAIALSAIGTGISAYSSYQQGKIGRQAAEFNAAEMRVDADRIDTEARTATTRQQSNSQRELATIKALMGKSGLDVGSGTNAEILAEKALLAEIELNDTRRRAGSESERLRRQAGVTEYSGKITGRAGVLGAGTDLLSGAGNIYTLTR